MRNAAGNELDLADAKVLQSFLQRHDPFHRVSMDSFLVDPAYPTLSFRKNVSPACWMKDTRWI